MESGKEGRTDLVLRPETATTFGDRQAKSPEDLLRWGIGVHTNVVEQRWGPQAAIEYSAAIASRIARTNAQKPTGRPGVF